MTFYLSRYVRDDISFENFIDGLQEYLLYAIRDPENNISELDKSIEPMLTSKIFSDHRPTFGLMYHHPTIAAAILQHSYLMYLLFYSRVFQRKHEWPICYLSPISKHLLRQNLLNKLPSIYIKYGGDIDLHRGTIYLSTCDYFFVSVICYPLKIGPQIPRILNQHFSSTKWKEHQKLATKQKQSFLAQFVSDIVGSLSPGNQLSDDLHAFSIPENPFTNIHHCYANVFQFYLNTFLPSNANEMYQQQQQQLQQQRFYSEYGIKFIEIIGELWFGQYFHERPIGDRCHTLPLMQDLLFRIMEKQMHYQHDYAMSSPQYAQRTDTGGGYKSKSMNFEYQSSTHSRLFGSGKIPKSSCLCPELRCLLRYLYLFFRESFEHFPLDFIANLRVIIEMFCYVLAPWTIFYKFKKPDVIIQKQKQSQRAYLEQQRLQKNKKFGIVWSVLSKAVSFVLKQPANDKKTEMMNQMDMAWMLNTMMTWNDDKERSMKFNNTQFENADTLVEYELDGIDAFDMRVWRQYIIEMLPFYSTLINYFTDALLKYDFNHPLKQLCVLKVLHVYKNEQIVALVQQAENCLFSPYSHTHGESGNDNNFLMGDAQNVMNLSLDNFASSEPMYLRGIVQDITCRTLNDYRCLPFMHDQNTESNQNASFYAHSTYPFMLSSINVTRTKARQLYIKCRKAMTRLCPTNKLSGIADIEEKQTEDHDLHQEHEDGQEEKEQTLQEDEKQEAKSTKDTVIVVLWWIFNFVLLCLRFAVDLLKTSTMQQRKETDRKTKTQPVFPSSMQYFVDSEDNVKIIRYVIGEIEDLFDITTQQQENLMNMSIMYEPSISPSSPAMQQPHRKKETHKSEQSRLYEYQKQETMNIWSRPQGEWEVGFLLAFNRW
eukprot:CAMPEP_0197039662 /NCGR_PEP_ID=MMETSP1384-20130603/16457_1 /TAXON_ID=29189 /ORGANISM="Ammonia sp." /LENGTH=879 /DNA_ID=CAMNT_0042470301 /DNA_START=62 /DNA_END=2698 /DNA_ORIENTATION=-